MDKNKDPILNKENGRHTEVRVRVKRIFYLKSSIFADLSPPGV